MKTKNSRTSSFLGSVKRLANHLIYAKCLALYNAASSEEIGERDCRAYLLTYFRTLPF